MDALLLTAGVVASRLGISTKTVHALVGRGELPAYRIGKQLRFRSEYVEQYVNRALVGVPSTVT